MKKALLLVAVALCATVWTLPASAQDDLIPGTGISSVDSSNMLGASIARAQAKQREKQARIRESRTSRGTRRSRHHYRATRRTGYRSRR